MVSVARRVRLPIRLSTLLLLASMVWFFVEAPPMTAPVDAGVFGLILSGLEWHFTAVAQNWYTMLPAIPFLVRISRPPPFI